MIDSSFVGRAALFVGCDHQVDALESKEIVSFVWRAAPFCWVLSGHTGVDVLESKEIVAAMGGPSLCLDSGRARAWFWAD